MAPLTQAEVDSIVAELAPQISTEDDKAKVGAAAYTALFAVRPEFIQMFRRLQGMTMEQIAKSDGLRHHGIALVDGLVKLVVAGADDERLAKECALNGRIHRRVPKADFQFSTDVFVEFFNVALKKEENKKAMEKFLKHIFSGITEKIS
ncbi:hypothetical protein AHF37_06201 [Paragonimus kellicotti]|nr:hypothetical protein AHF37_06201 [Paragonimus kellicotti]